MSPCLRIVNAHNRNRVKYWEIIADNLSRAGFSWGYVSAIDSNGRRIWIADAHQGDEKRCLKKNASVMRIRSRSPYKGLPSPRR